MGFKRDLEKFTAENIFQSVANCFHFFFIKQKGYFHIHIKGLRLQIFLSNVAS